jgi:hypothetical protein
LKIKFRKLILSNNQIHRLTISDIRSYKRLQQIDLSFNRLQYVDMLLVNYLKNLKQLFLNSNMLRTLNNNITFPNNFHLKLSSNPLECDCRLRWLRNALNRLEYPIYHDEPQCEMPKTLADKKILTLRDEQFVCGPIISKPDLTVLAVTTGEVATLRCDVRKLNYHSIPLVLIILYKYSLFVIIHMITIRLRRHFKQLIMSLSI